MMASLHIALDESFTAVPPPMAMHHGIATLMIVPIGRQRSIGMSCFGPRNHGRRIGDTRPMGRITA